MRCCADIGGGHEDATELPTSAVASRIESSHHHNRLMRRCCVHFTSLPAVYALHSCGDSFLQAIRDEGSSMQSNVCPAVHFVSLFRLDGDTGRAAHDAIRAAELGEDAVRLRHQRHAVAKMPKVGVALALIVVVTLGAIDEMHCPLVGSVWQRLTVSGKVTAPVVAVAVMEALAPTLTVATAKALEPDVPVMCRMPSFYAVAAGATMSGTGVVEAE